MAQEQKENGHRRSKLALTVDVKNQFHKAKLKEKVNIKHLYLFTNNPHLLKNSNTKNELGQLIGYSKLFKKSSKLASIKYKKSKSTTAGRVYARKSLSLQNIRKPIRHTLAKEFYVDIDVENAHPTILHQICLANKIKCPMLSKYVEKREEVLQCIVKKYDLKRYEGLVSRDDAKDLFISLMYLGSADNWAKQRNVDADRLPKFVSKFSNELTTIADIIYENNSHLHSRNSATNDKTEKKTNDETEVKINDKTDSASKTNPASIENSIFNGKNPKARVLSLFVQEYENQILYSMYEYLKENNFIKNNIATLCFDGIMVLKNENINDKLLSNLCEYVFDETGLKIVLKIKPMDKDITNELLQCNKFKYDDILQALNVPDDSKKETVELKENRDILTAIPNKEPCLQPVNVVWAVAQASKRIGIAKDDYLAWSNGKNANTWDNIDTKRGGYGFPFLMALARRCSNVVQGFAVQEFLSLSQSPHIIYDERYCQPIIFRDLLIDNADKYLLPNQKPIDITTQAVVVIKL